MANKRQLRVIARNLVARLALVAEFVTPDDLSEEEKDKLHEHVRQVAYSIVKKCYRSYEWDPNKIVKDVLKNVK